MLLVTHNAIAHLQYSVNLNALGSQKIHLTMFTVVFALVQIENLACSITSAEKKKCLYLF